MKNNIKLSDYLGCKENEVFNICGLSYKVVGNYIYYKDYNGNYIKR